MVSPVSSAIIQNFNFRSVYFHMFYQSLSLSLFHAESIKNHFVSSWLEASWLFLCENQVPNRIIQPESYNLTFYTCLSFSHHINVELSQQGPKRTIVQEMFHRWIYSVAVCGRSCSKPVWHPRCVRITSITKHFKYLNPYTFIVYTQLWKCLGLFSMRI